MKGKHLQSLVEVNAEHALYKEDGTWYHHLKKFPGVLFDKNGYILFHSKEDYEKNEFLKHTKHLHVAKGIRTIPGYINFSTQQKALLFANEVALSIETREEIIRKIRQIELVVRNRTVVATIKSLYEDTCQLCGTRISIRKGLYYSEVHHIKPLGSPHFGPDTIGNLICVCANCHVLVDLGARSLEKEDFKILLHELRSENLNYHNKYIFGKTK